MNETSNSRPALRLIGGALAAFFVLWLALGSDDELPASETNAALEDSAAGPGASSDAAAAPIRLGPGRRVGSGEGPWVTRLQREKANYEQSAVYPHWSRPHYDGTQYKLEWNEAITPEVQFNESSDDPIFYAFGADKMHVMFGDTYTSHIEVWRAGRKTERLPAKVKSAWVMVKQGGNQGRAIPLEYRDAGDHRYENTFTPAQHHELRAGNAVRIEAMVEVEGETRLLTRELTYATQPVLEVVGITDAVVDGSLVVSLDVEVYEPGLHTFEANCMTGDGETAIAYSKKSYPLETGRSRVDLVFFGKIFHDAGVDGPYLVRDIRGLRRSDGEGQNLHWSVAEPYLTAAHTREALSPDAWESDEKTEKLANFDKLIENARRRNAGGAPADPVALGADHEILTPR